MLDGEWVLLHLHLYFNYLENMISGSQLNTLQG